MICKHFAAQKIATGAFVKNTFVKLFSTLRYPPLHPACAPPTSSPQTTAWKSASSSGRRAILRLNVARGVEVATAMGSEQAARCLSSRSAPGSSRACSHLHPGASATAQHQAAARHVPTCAQPSRMGMQGCSLLNRCCMTTDRLSATLIPNIPSICLTERPYLGLLRPCRIGS